MELTVVFVGGPRTYGALFRKLPCSGYDFACAARGGLGLLRA